KHEADDQGTQARRGRPERDEPPQGNLRNRELQDVQQHQENASVMRSTTRSVLMPRDPFTSTRSPAESHGTTMSAAARLELVQVTESAGMPAPTAASAIVRAASPPTATSRARPAAADA